MTKKTSSKTVIPACLHPLEQAFDQPREDGSGKWDKICGLCGVTMCEIKAPELSTEEQELTSAKCGNRQCSMMDTSCYGNCRAALDLKTTTGRSKPVDQCTAYKPLNLANTFPPETFSETMDDHPDGEDHEEQPAVCIKTECPKFSADEPNGCNEFAYAEECEEAIIKEAVHAATQEETAEAGAEEGKQAAGDDAGAGADEEVSESTPFQPKSKHELEPLLWSFCRKCHNYKGKDNSESCSLLPLLSYSGELQIPSRYPAQWVIEAGHPKCTSFVEKASEEIASYVTRAPDKIGGRFQELLPVPVDDHELGKLGTELSEQVELWLVTKADLSKYTSAAKEVIKNAEARMVELKIVIMDQARMAPVDCHWEFDFASGEKIPRRLDTWTEVKRETLTVEERQPSLFDQQAQQSEAAVEQLREVQGGDQVKSPDEPPLLYRPSNGTEGECFTAEWCEHCSKDDHDNEVFCDILTRTTAFSIDDPEYPREWCYGDTGQPICTAFDVRVEVEPAPEKISTCQQCKEQHPDCDGCCNSCETNQLCTDAQFCTLTDTGSICSVCLGQCGEHIPGTAVNDCLGFRAELTAEEITRRDNTCAEDWRLCPYASRCFTPMNEGDGEHDGECVCFKEAEEAKQTPEVLS
jgi:hypothetical protein